MKTKIFIVALISLFIIFPTLVHTQEGYVSVPAAAFKSASETEDYLIYSGWAGLYDEHYITKPTTDGALIAPVYFPKSGVKAKNMRVTLYDNTSTGRIEVFLFRVSLSTGKPKPVFSVWTLDSSTPGLVKKMDATGTNRLVANDKFAWYILVRFFGNPYEPYELKLYSVKIKYQ